MASRGVCGSGWDGELMGLFGFVLLELFLVPFRPFLDVLGCFSSLFDPHCWETFIVFHLVLLQSGVFSFLFLLLRFCDANLLDYVRTNRSIETILIYQSFTQAVTVYRA